MIQLIFDFIEINWAAFLEHCRQGGLDEELADAEFEKIKTKHLE